MPGIVNNIDSLISDLNNIKKNPTNLNKKIIIDKANKVFRDDPVFANRVKKEIEKMRQVTHQ